MRVSELLSKLVDVASVGEDIHPGMTLNGATSDSRTAGPNDLFIALPGTRSQGVDYLPEVFAGGDKDPARRFTLPKVVLWRWTDRRTRHQAGDGERHRGGRGHQPSGTKNGQRPVENEPEYKAWSLRGEPDLDIRLDRVDAGSNTASQAVNRIEDVVDARPGYVTLERLPKLRYRRPFNGAAC